LILLCALVCFFAFRAFNPTSEPVNVSVIGPVLPEPKPVIAPDNPVLEEIILDLVELPGLGGQWWFAEMPWYLPSVREAVPRILRQEENEWISAYPLPHLDPNISLARKFLWGLTVSASKEFPTYKKVLVENLHLAFDQRLEEKEMLTELRKILFDYDEAIALLPETERTASDEHTIALLQHWIVQLSSNQTLVQTTKESYERALKKYAEAAENNSNIGRIARQLHKVCLSDFARFSFWADNDFSVFEKRAKAILDSTETRPSELFRIEFLTTYGDYSTAARKNNDSLFEEANEVLDTSKIANSNHPLQAYIYERFAWSLIDQCRFKEAEDQFDEALRYRQNNLQNTRNPFAAIYVFHNQHGLAICRRYLGDTEGAKTRFDGVAQRVEAALKQTDFGESAQQRYFSSLNERLSNTLERWGDCVLYGGAASFGTPYSRIQPSDMKLAAELYDRSREAATSKAVWYVMSCKAAIIKSMSGSLEEAKAILDKLAEEYPGIAFGSDQPRATMMRDVANFIYQLKQNEQSEPSEENEQKGLISLQRFLMQFDSDTFNESRYRREPLELQLFCAEVLITSKLKAGDTIAARDEVPRLRSLLSPFTSFQDTRPFFYRFYDLAILCLNESQQDQSNSIAKEQAILEQLRFVRQSRLWKSPSDGDEDQGTFFFYFSPQRGQKGIVIFAPADKTQPTLRFTISHTRQEVQEAAGSGEPSFQTNSCPGIILFLL